VGGGLVGFTLGVLVSGFKLLFIVIMAASLSIFEGPIVCVAVGVEGDGKNVGILLAVAVGEAVGENDIVGLDDGSPVGDCEGDGKNVGILLAVAVGEAVGENDIVGLDDGSPVGDCEGDVVGGRVGGFVGLRVGGFVGVFVGVFEGEVLGDNEGLSVFFFANTLLSLSMRTLIRIKYPM